MSQIQLVLPIARDFTSLYIYSQMEKPDAPVEQKEQGQWGMVFTWVRPAASPLRLVCLGVDICGVGRWQQVLARTPQTVLRAFTSSEMRWAAAQPERLAVLWSIKEALLKALGCGFGGLAYQDIVVEFLPDSLSILLPAALSTDLPEEQRVSDLCWQLLLFGESMLPGALVIAWKRVYDEPGFPACVPVSSVSHVAEATACSRIVLELRSISIMQSGTRREKLAAERLLARQIACSAVARLLPLCSHQCIHISKAHSGRPLLLVTDRAPAANRQLSLSLSHCSGRAAAALGGSLLPNVLSCDVCDI